MDLLSFVLQAEEIDTIMHFAAQVGQHSTPQHSSRAVSGLQHGSGSRAVLSMAAARKLWLAVIVQRAVPVLASAWVSSGNLPLLQPSKQPTNILQHAVCPCQDDIHPPLPRALCARRRMWTTALVTAWHSP